MTDLLAKSLEGAMTVYGNKYHARIKGEQGTLCGLKPTGYDNGHGGARVTVYRVDIDVRPRLVTCKKCRKEMGL